MKKRFKKSMKKVKKKKDELFDENKTFGEKALVVFMIGLITLAGLSLAFILFIIINSPSFTEDKLYSAESSILYDKDGKEFARIGTENRELVSYDELPEVFIDSLLATEDSRFMQHNGVDMARFVKATIGQLKGDSGAGGASTLTMQIVKQKITDDTATGIKGIIRKFTDVYISVFKVEKKYTKEQIIEFYVNTPFLSSGAYGIGQASQTFFGKDVSELNLVESALISGMFQAPSAYDPFNYPDVAQKRRDRVLDLMQRHKYITKEEMEIAKKIDVEDMLIKREVISNPYQGMIDTVIEEVRERTELDPYLTSMKIYTLFDRDKQKVIDDIYNGVTFTWPNDKAQAAVSVIDVKTGAITAIGAGRNKSGELSYNFATMINRHPGSAAKPIFDYGPAIEYLGYGTGQLVIDDVYTYSDGKTIRNWDRGYRGMMTLRNALAFSRNIPAVYLFQQVPQKDLSKFVDNIGMNPEYDSEGRLHEAHALGGYNGTNPVELSAAYATFARGGIYIEPHSFTKVEFVKNNETYIVTPEKRTVMKDSTAYMINMSLRTAVTSGFSPATSVSGTDVASKTGTTTIGEDDKKKLNLPASAIGDSWQVTYSPDSVIAIWIGYEEFTKDYYLTNAWGVSTRNFFSRTLSRELLDRNSRFKKPNSIVSATIEFGTNPVMLASKYTPDNLKYTELFRKGTAPTEVSQRFAQLSDPSNLSVNQSGNKSTLTWDPAPIPNFIQKDYLSNYFSKGYGTWANRYLNQRLTYNKNTLGQFGYEVFLKSNKTVSLGWTESNTFTYSGSVPANAEFIVKSSYSNFKSNASKGISIKANEIEGSDIETSPAGDISISMKGSSCMNHSIFKSMIDSNDLFVNVLEDNNDVSNNATTKNICYDSDDNEVSCKNLSSNEEYTVAHEVSYKDKSDRFIRTINSNC